MDDILEKIATHDGSAVFWFRLVELAWDKAEGQIWKARGRIALSTCGSTRNKAVIEAMRKNKSLWERQWLESRKFRGYHLFVMPK